MTQPTETVNYAVVVGTLEARDRQRQRRNAMRASVTDIRMPLMTPFGAPFVLPLTPFGAVASSYKLVAGTPIAVEGYVRMERENPSDEERAAYLRELRRLSDAPRWRVLAGHVAAVGEAEAISEREARALRREMNRERTQSQDGDAMPPDEPTQI